MGDFSFNNSERAANNKNSRIFDLIPLKTIERYELKMKKFALCLFAAFAALTLSIGASAVTGTNGGGIVGAAENVVGGVARGAEDIVGGVARGAEDIIGGTHGTHRNHAAHGNHITENKDVNPIPRAYEGVSRNEHARGANNTAHHNDRNPSTAVGFGIVEIATIGATMLGTAAIAGGKKRR
ncbi:MAG: hypothetical protein FWD48_09445 [Oscillospiraceae bacterium]|nr:hypothetical protein [Oscillospiraceae bacterium]